MISRRQLRIKALQTLYAYYTVGMNDISKAEKELLFNINKAFDLYHSIFILLLEIANYAESRIEMARNKLQPSKEDLHPNMKFVECSLLDQIRNSDQLLRYVDVKKITWVNYPELIKGLYQKFQEDPGYKDYMESETNTFTEQRKMLTSVLTNVIYPDENLESVLEEQSIYWNDDLEYMISMVIKTLKKFQESGKEKSPLLDLYKNPDNRKIPEDKEFAVELFRKTIVKYDEYLVYIKKNTKNWEVERIAFMDVLLMQMAITEFMNFPSIPTKVTLNEYLEISKLYSTSKSSVFINGILDRVAMQLRENKKINKSGRGLIGENDES